MSGVEPDGLAIVTDAWDTHGGGREQYLAEIARALAARGWSVDVFAPVVAARPESIPGVRVHQTGAPRLRGIRAIGMAVERYRIAHPPRPVLAARAMPGASHCQLHSGLCIDAFEAERASFESVLRRWGFRPGVRVNGWRRHLLRDEARVCSPRETAAIMTFSGAMRDDLCRRFGTPPARVTVLPLGIDLRTFHPRDRAPHPEGPLRLLFAGHNFRLKGLWPALTALAVVRGRGVDGRLAIAGRGSRRLAEREARRLGVGGAIEFLGAVDPDTMPSHYRQAHALIHPTFYDPFPRVVLEALACGCPVVTTRACGVAEHIADGREGFVIPDARSVGALAEAIAALGDRARWDAMSDAAARLGARFDFDRHVDALVEWLAGTH